MYDFGQVSLEVAVEVVLTSSGYRSFGEDYSARCQLAADSELLCAPSATRLVRLSRLAPWSFVLWGQKRRQEPSVG